ncbi:MAG: hypothetical protein LUQ32_05005 [Methanomicrobiales archaeon]|nr:hypothetical protein [Methanomicrobiales archaeon]
MNQETDRGGSGQQVTAPQGGTQEKPKPEKQSEMKSFLVQGLYGILFLIILIAAVQLYFSIQEFIRLWFSEEFIPIVNSLYYLVVIAGGIYLIREYLRGS